MAKAAPQPAEKEAVEIPEHLKMDKSAFESQAGDVFGGASEILILEEETAAGPLTYLGHRLTDLGNGIAPANIHEAKDAEGATWRLPIATNFQRQVEGANLQKGDRFAMLRLKDVIKQKGVGANRPMQMYQIKVLGRAPVAAVAQ